MREAEIEPGGVPRFERPLSNSELLKDDFDGERIQVY